MPHKDLDERRAYARAYHAAHLIQCRAYTAKSSAKHPAARKARKAAYRRKHRAEMNAKNKAYWTMHQDTLRAKKRAYMVTYQATHRAERNVIDARHEALKRALPATLTIDQWKAILQSYGNRCAYCGQKFKRLTQDHVVPLIKGGGTTSDNIVPACQSCNSSKGSGHPIIVPALRLML